MIRTNKIQRILVFLCICFCITTIVIEAAGNDDWTEAKYTTKASKESWENWCKSWEKIKKKPIQMVLTPGTDATQMNFSWYSYMYDIKPILQISTNKFMHNPTKLQVNTTMATKGFYSNKAVASHLKENKTYYYQYTLFGKKTKVYSFRTRNPKKYEFIFVGDPQIGSSFDNIPYGEKEKQGQSKGVCNDSFNWNSTLQTAYSKVKNASFVISAGDQIQSRNLKNSKKNYLTFSKNEMEYAGFLMPRILRSLPIATSIGNHDYLSGNYTYHFNNPNSHTGLGKTYAGENYYFNYGDTIFIMLNTNNPNIDEHDKFIKKAIKSNPNAKWRFVTMHQDIFGSGEHSRQKDIIHLRSGLLPVLRKYNINIVLTGHDHTYARAFIKNDDTSYDGKKNSNDIGSVLFDNNSMKNKEEYEKISANIVSYKSEDGILFITGNSSSGSKYYKLISYPQKYVEYRSQENKFSFSTIKVNENSIQFDTYYTETGDKVDKTIIITRKK